MSKKKNSKGNFYVQTSKGIIPFEVLQKAAMSSAESKQLSSIQSWMTSNDLVSPPYGPLAFLHYYFHNTIFARCVKQLALDVAGLGWSLQLRDNVKESKQEFARISELLDNIHPDSDEDLRSMLEKLLIDWGTVGYFGWEIARNNKGDVNKAFHVPAYTIRVHKDNKKYAQIRNNKKMWFKKFGEEQNIRATTGKEVTGRGKDVANEMIFYKNYYPLSDFYGAPNVLSAVGDLVGLAGLQEYNLAFFENYGIPAALITLEGDWEPNAEKLLDEFVNTELKGSGNAHRTLVGRVDAGSNKAQPNKLTYTKLGVDVKEGSFKLYEKARQESIMIAYSMPPQRIGIQVAGKLGGNIAEEATRIYVRSVVEPLQLDMEDILNSLIQSEVYRFKFNNIDTRDMDALSERQVREIGAGSKTPNEARNENGKEPYPDGDKFYIQSSFIPVGEAEEATKLAKEDLEELDG